MTFVPKLLLQRTIFLTSTLGPSVHAKATQPLIISANRTLTARVCSNSTTTFSHRSVTMAADPRQFMRTSGNNDPVWVHTEPYSNRPQFSQLNQDVETDVCIIGSGIAGISVAEQLVRRDLKVAMVEARDILSGIYCSFLSQSCADSCCRRDRSYVGPLVLRS